MIELGQYLAVLPFSTVIVCIIYLFVKSGELRREGKEDTMREVNKVIRNMILLIIVVLVIFGTYSDNKTFLLVTMGVYLIYILLDVRIESKLHKT